MDIAKQLVGKPVCFYAKGKKRTIGVVTDAEIRDNKLHYTTSITDLEVAKLLQVDIEGISSVPSSVSG